MVEIIYRPAMIVTADALDRDNEDFPKEELFGKYNSGKFVICASEDEVRLYGLLFTNKENKSYSRDLDIITHKDIERLLFYMKKQIEGGEIAGGILSIDLEKKIISADGESGRFGSAPRVIIEGCLNGFPEFEIKVCGKDTAGTNCPRTRKWYIDHGIKVDNYFIY